MNEVLPRHVICVLGNWKTIDEVEQAIAYVGQPGFEIDYDYCQFEPDDRMSDAFAAAADRVTPSFSDDDLKAVENHTAVAYVLSPLIPQASALQISGITLAVVAALLEHGALAAKNESSGVAHGAKQWLHYFSEFKTGYAQDDPAHFGNALYQAWVRRPLSDDEWWYTCGMHLLGQPDVELQPLEDAREGIRCMDFVSGRLIEGEPVDQLVQDQILLSEEDEPRNLRHMVCRRYEPDDFFFNPYGYIRVAHSN